MLKPDAAIFTQACPLFVPLVEEGWYDDEITALVARRYLQGLVDKDVDTLLLGCTHYPLIEAILARIMGGGYHRRLGDVHGTRGEESCWSRTRP